MGISTEKNKKVALVDNDNIELSNLNRQFLFNKSIIGKSKSDFACNSIKKRITIIIMRHYNIE